MAVRDLWTKFQFELLKELIVVKNASDAGLAQLAGRERIRGLAEAFCSDLDKASSAELTDFRTAFLTSLSELDAAAKKGSEDVTKQIQETAAAAAKAATDAKAAAEKAAAEAEAAAKAATEAAKPGFLNLTIVGDFDDEIAISVDGTEEIRTHGKTLAIERVPPGLKKISAKGRRADKVVETSIAVDVKPGVQDVRLTLG